MEAIHNRSRNRKQDRRPRWKSNNNNGNGQQKPWHNNNDNNNNSTLTQEIIDNANHDKLTKSLHTLCTTRNLIESSSGMQKRERVMKDLDAMLFAWSESLLPGSPTYAENLSHPNPDNTAAPSLLSFGSYRLGVHTPDADVDCLVLAPPHVTRDDFFDSWVGVLKGEERVTELHPVSGAYTPVIKFEMDLVKIDLIFARVNNSKWLTEQRSKMNQSPIAHRSTEEEGKSSEAEDDVERIEMSVDDTVLVGLDETSVRSVNGVRVGRFLLNILEGDATRAENFRLTLRAVKEWARVHGLYGNVLGFLGGVNWAILVAKIVNLHPDAPASKLLPLFFRTFAHWAWPNPVYLSKEKQMPPDGVNPLPVWDPNENFRDSKHLMPIITPCYPQMNSSYNVGEPQLRRLSDELCRASKLSGDILSGKKDWDVLISKNDFFKQHVHYLQINIIGEEEDGFREWFGLCESRIRLLIAGLESPMAGVRAYPFAKFYHRREGDKYVATFFIALRFAPWTERVDLGPLVSEYLTVVNMWDGRREGMDLTIHLVAKKYLPSYVFAATNVTAAQKANVDVAKGHIRQHGVKDGDTKEGQSSDTITPAKRKHLDADVTPSINISALKRTSISGESDENANNNEPSETPAKRKKFDETTETMPSELDETTESEEISPLKQTRIL